MKYKTQKRPKPKTVRTVDYNCAYVMEMAVLVIFPVILQTVFNLIIVYIGPQGECSYSTYFEFFSFM